MPFISFSCLIALAGTSCTTLNRNDENGPVPCLTVVLKMNTSCFLMLSMMLTGFVRDAAYYFEVSSFNTKFESF